MNNGRAWLVGLALLMCVEGVARATNPPTLKGKAGVFVRVDPGLDPADKKLLLNNPLVDGAVLMWNWRFLEPQKGQYSLDSLKAEVKLWGNAGKGVIITAVPYGQTPFPQLTPSGAHHVRQTPDWVYDEPNVTVVEFAGGGTAAGQKIAVPAVWRDSFVTTYLDPLAAVLGQAFDGDPTVWFVRVGLGHIGHVTAAACAEGSTAFMNAGWTPGLWSQYCSHLTATYRKHFPQTPLLVIAEKHMMLYWDQRNYVAEEAALLKTLGDEGVSILHLGLVDQAALVQQTYTDLNGALPDANQATIRIGAGDDWPLWVPPSRRYDPATKNHDELYLRTSLSFAFGGASGLPNLPSTMLYLQPVELIAANPKNTRLGENGYFPEVYSIIKSARDKLLANDLAIFK
jgi:hypothetical protein